MFQFAALEKATYDFWSSQSRSTPSSGMLLVVVVAINDLFNEVAEFSGDTNGFGGTYCLILISVGLNIMDNFPKLSMAISHSQAPSPAYLLVHDVPTSRKCSIE